MTPTLSPSSLIERIAALPGVELCEHEPLARHTSMAVGGPARWFAVVADDAALEATVALLRPAAPLAAPMTAPELPWMILGGGSNTIFTDGGFDGLVLTLGRGFRTVVAGPEPGQVMAGAAAPLSAVMNFAKRAGLTGLEFAAGIPGQLGGALAGNAGTRAGEVCALADAVEVIDAAGRRVTRPRGSFNYGYRHSDLRREIILRATLSLQPDAPEAIQARIDATLTKRGEQPIGLHCSGCMFRNPEGDFAGRLIEQAGLKGHRIGGARISEQHANFMINDGTATAGDLCQLIELVRQRVHERYQVNLSLEIRLVGLDSPPEIH